MEEYNNDEFNWIIQPIIDNKEYQKLKEVSHHGSTRFDHSMRVAYYTYLTAKFFHLDDYQATTKAALLHDFFIDEVTLTIGDSKIELSPLSYVIADSNKGYISYYDKDSDTLKTVEVNDNKSFVEGEFYKVYVSVDQIDYYGTDVILTAKIDELNTIDMKGSK